MVEVNLYARDGSFVAAVLVPQFEVPPEVLCWGARFFSRRAETGRYQEIFASQVFTRAEHDAMTR